MDILVFIYPEINHNAVTELPVANNRISGYLITITVTVSNCILNFASTGYVN